MSEWNGPAELVKAVTAAYADYEPEPDQDHTGRLVAVRCDSKGRAKAMVKDLESMGFDADRFKHDGVWYARITDLHDTDPDDAIFEIGWHGVEVGTIPDTRAVLLGEDCRSGTELVVTGPGGSDSDSGTGMSVIADLGEEQ